MSRALVIAALVAVLAPHFCARAANEAPPPSAFERESAGHRWMVRKIVVEGARSLPERALREALAPYEGRELGESDLRDIERRLTQLYLDRGFATSGVRLKHSPDAQGEAAFEAIEGTVARVRFVQPPRFSDPRWVTSLLVPDPREPAQLDALQERMTGLRESGIVERINAELVPLPRLGESELVVSVEERRPWAIELRYDNYHPPAVGARRPSAIFTDTNVTGWGDRFDARIGHTEGLHDVRVEYLLPVPRTSWRVGARFERDDSLAIDPPAFRDLQITSVVETRAGQVGYAWISRPTLALNTWAAYERRESESSLLGIPFSFITGLVDAKARADVWRVSADVTAPASDHVAFARIQASRGTTNVPEDAPQAAPAARFTSYVAQAQYARRLTESGLQTLARVDGQYTGDVLLPMEKKAIGGIETVRGYRENVLLRDRGVAATLELRHPLWRWGDSVRLIGSVFIDAGWARDVIRRNDGLPATIASAGVGLAAVLPWGFAARVDLAYPNHRWLTERSDSQDRGIHFMVSWTPTVLIP